MAEGIGNLEATIERLHAATQEAREATREVHSATKALRQAERDAAATMEAQRMAALTMVNDTVGAAIDGAFSEIRSGIDKALDRVEQTFVKHLNLFLFGNEQGRGTSIIERINDQLLAGSLALDRVKRPRPGDDP